MRKFVISLLLLAASGLPLMAQPPQSSARAEVERLNQAMMDAFKRGQPNEIAAIYSEDARIIGPSGSAIEGRAAVNRYWSSFPTEGRTWTLEVIDVGGTRDIVYQLGKSSIVGPSRSMVTDWIGIWKRQPDGSLKLAVDYWVPAGK